MTALTLPRVTQRRWLFWLAAFTLAGCTTTQYQSSGSRPSGQTVTTGTSTARPATESKPRQVDLQPLAKRAAASIVKRSAGLGLAVKPTLYVDMLRNGTGRQQDTAKITATLHKELARSGRFKLIPLEKNAAYQQSLDYQQSEGAMNPSTAVQLGRQTGADLILYGTVSRVKKSNTYQLTTQLMELTSGELLFSDKQSVRK